MPLVCPACGARNIETVALSLHGPRVPAVVEAIKAGTFQCFSCAGCGAAYRADGPVIYVDFEHKRWIGAFPAAMEASWARLEQQPIDSFRRSLIDLAPAFLRNEADGFTVRSVFGLEALAEKILLLEAGLDDRAVEAAKLATVLRAGAVLAPGHRPRVVRADAASVTFVLWSTPASGGPAEQGQATVGIDELGRIAVDPGWAGLLAELGTGPYVDLGRLLLDGRVPLEPAAA